MQSSVAESPCLRNPVTQHALEGFIERYLEETGKKLELLTETSGKHLTDKMWKQHDSAWAAFESSIALLTGYLAEHHTDEYNAILREHKADPTMSPDDFIAAIATCYRTNFDPVAIGAEIKRLDAKHGSLRRECLKLTAPLAIKKTNCDILALETRIAELENQRDDAAGVVEQHYRDALDLQSDIAEAKLAMRSESGERLAPAGRSHPDRRKAHRVRIHGDGGGPGKSNARLATVTIYPVTGDPAEFSVDHDNVLRPTSDVSR
jgi:hypothetical protein